MKGARAITVVGHFAYARGDEGDKKVFGGQTAKCRTLAGYLSGKFGSASLDYVDTYQWKRRLFDVVSHCVRAARRGDVVLLVLSRNGLSALLPLLVTLRKRYFFAIGYVVVGAWLVEACKEDRKLLSSLQKIDEIFAETTKQRDDLRKLGLSCVSYVPNAKHLPVLDCPWDVSKPNGEVRFCTFSRVCKDKGITDAIEAVSMANSILGSDICRLDIYGTVDKSFSDEFYKLVEENAHCASYKGSVPADESVTAISCCAALLFPTYHDGFPGTVIDGLAAGVPIIAYEWDYAHYVIDEGLTGVIVPSCDIDALANVIVDFASSPSKYEYMRKNCLIAAEAYQPENAMKPIFDFIQQGSILATD